MLFSNIYKWPPSFLLVFIYMSPEWNLPWLFFLKFQHTHTHTLPISLPCFVFLLGIIHYLTYYILYFFFVSPNRKFHGARICLLCSQMYSQCLKWCLAPSRHSTALWWVNVWGSTKNSSDDCSQECQKHQYSILTHIYGTLKDGNNNPEYETAKETLMSNIHLNLEQDQTWVFSFLQNNVIFLEDIPWLRWINIPPSLQDLLLLTCTLLFCFEFFLNNIYYPKLYCIFTHA